MITLNNLTIAGRVIIGSGSSPPSGPPVADFIATTPTTGGFPISVEFEDTSTGNPTDWEWDFGDGATSTEQDPYHIYETAGDYEVSLDVSNSSGSNLNSKPDFVDVTTAPPGPMRVFRDTFDGPAVELSLHKPNVGNAWVYFDNNNNTPTISTTGSGSAISDDQISSDQASYQTQLAYTGTTGFDVSIFNTASSPNESYNIVLRNDNSGEEFYLGLSAFTSVGGESGLTTGYSFTAEAAGSTPFFMAAPGQNPGYPTSLRMTINGADVQCFVNGNAAPVFTGTIDVPATFGPINLLIYVGKTASIGSVSLTVGNPTKII